MKKYTRPTIVIVELQAKENIAANPMEAAVSPDGTTLTAMAGLAHVFTLTTDVSTGSYTLTTYQPLDLASLQATLTSGSLGGSPQAAYYYYNDGTLSSNGNLANDWEVKISSPNDGAADDNKRTHRNLGCS